MPASKDPAPADPSDNDAQSDNANQSDNDPVDNRRPRKRFPQRTTLPTHHPRWRILITDDGSRTLWDPRTAVAFHSGCGARAETEHVYLHHSGTKERLAGQAINEHNEPWRVLELGLGTGQAMLATMDTAITHHAALDYTAIELDWIDADLVERLKHEVKIRPDLVSAFVAWRRSIAAPTRGSTYQWNFSQRQRLSVAIGAADEVLVNLLDRQALFNAIYFDPFDPETNPALWTIDTASKMHRMLADGGRLVTYCVNRKVRDNFAAAGFNVFRLPGPIGGKREVMMATKTTDGDRGNANLKLASLPSLGTSTQLGKSMK